MSKEIKQTFVIMAIMFATAVVGWYIGTLLARVARTIIYG